MRRRFVSLPINRHLGFAFLAFCAAAAHADLIVSPIGASTLFSTGDDDTAHVDLNATYQFFGNDFNSVDVSTNGNMNWIASSEYNNVPFPDGNAGAMIAPLWDDFTLFNTSRIYEAEGTGYLAVTWSDLSTFNSSESTDTFQALVFDQNENLNGFSFHKGDIAFSYGALGDSLSFDDSATVGLNNDDGSKGIGLPGSNKSVLSASDLSLLDPVKDDFILFRFNGSGYDSSYQHTGQQAVPEPGTIFVVGAGLVGLARKSRKRRRPYRDIR